MTRRARNKPRYRLHNDHGRSAADNVPHRGGKPNLRLGAAVETAWDDESLARIDLAESTRATIRCACRQTRFPERLEKSWTRDPGYKAAWSSCEASSNMLVRDLGEIGPLAPSDRLFPERRHMDHVVGTKRATTIDRSDSQGFGREFKAAFVSVPDCGTTRPPGGQETPADLLYRKSSGCHGWLIRHPATPRVKVHQRQ